MLNEYILEVNGINGKKQYRVINIEFYYYEKGLHEDENTHGVCSDRAKQRQLMNGEWYLHKKSVSLGCNYKGLDYTIGDGKNFGGILIKEVVRIKDDKKFSQSLFINELIEILVPNHTEKFDDKNKEDQKRKEDKVNNFLENIEEDKVIKFVPQKNKDEIIPTIRRKPAKSTFKYAKYAYKVEKYCNNNKKGAYTNENK